MVTQATAAGHAEDLTEGMRVTREQLKARWAFSELKSERWRATYATYPLEKIRQYVAFADLLPEEIAYLGWIAVQCRKNQVPELNRADECPASAP